MKELVLLPQQIQEQSHVMTYKSRRNVVLFLKKSEILAVHLCLIQVLVDVAIAFFIVGRVVIGVDFCYITEGWRGKG